jgi:hypothetical protein
MPDGNIDPDITEQSGSYETFLPRPEMANTPLVRSLSTLTLRYVTSSQIPEMDWDNFHIGGGIAY